MPPIENESILSKWDSSPPSTVEISVVEPLTVEEVKHVPLETIEERNKWIESWRTRKVVTKEPTPELDLKFEPN